MDRKKRGEGGEEQRQSRVKEWNRVRRAGAEEIEGKRREEVERGKWEKGLGKWNQEEASFLE